MLRHRSGGFVLAEFAIALPLLILLGVGLANIGAKIFQLGKNQLADYTLEAEAQYVMERIAHQARSAKDVEVDHYGATVDRIKFVYHTLQDERYTANIADVLETQYLSPSKNYTTGIFTALHAKRQPVGPSSHPITGGNYFGETQINVLKYERIKKIFRGDDDREKIFYVLHVTLEMESVVSGHKIRLATAVFMPSCESFRMPEDWQ